MMSYLLHPLTIFFEFVLYLIVDNITKLFVARFTQAHRFDILIGECLFLGFLIGFISYCYYVPFTLGCLLVIHTIGTWCSKRNAQISSESIRRCINGISQRLSQPVFRHSPASTSQGRPLLPQKYLYNYHLKPTHDVRLQQASFVQTLPRPGITNLYGTTCSLNALLQSLASFHRFYSSLQRSANFSRFTYDPIVPSYLNLLSRLHNDHQTSDYKHWNTRIDTSEFISQLQITHPELLTRTTTTDVCELFQSILDTLNTALSKRQSSDCSSNVIEQVQNSKLATLSLDHLNKLFADTEAQLHDKITLDNLDAQTFYIVQYVDLTWLLHHLQLGSIIKHTFSGQLLHAHCCNSCSHIRFRTEPFQILILPLQKTNTTVERLILQLAKIEIINSIVCSHCSNLPNGDPKSGPKVIQHESLLSTMATNLSPIVTTRRPVSDQIFVSTPIPSPRTFIQPTPTKLRTHRIKSQTMIANFPDVLCIQLKRFSYDRLSHTATKLDTSILVEPDKILDLSSLHYSTWLGVDNLSISFRYRLVSLCLHLSDKASSTSRINGHCVCLYRTDHQRWFLSDDERITEITQADHFFQTPYVTQNCYLLFYERCS